MPDLAEIVNICAFIIAENCRFDDIQIFVGKIELRNSCSILRKRQIRSIALESIDSCIENLAVFESGFSPFGKWNDDNEVIAKRNVTSFQEIIILP